MKQATKRFLSLTLSLFFIVGAVIIYFSFIQLAYQDLQGEKEKVLSKEIFLSTQQAAIGKVKDFIASYSGGGSLQGISDAVSTALPPGEETSNALVQLSGILGQSGLTLKVMNFSVSGIKNIAPAASGKSPAQSKKLAKPYGTIRIQTQFSGSYENLKRFLEKLETSLRIFDVENITFAPLDRGKDNFSYNMTVVTYYQSL